MCRLLGFAAASPTNLRALVGASPLAQFTALSRVHGDGWGTSWLAAHDPADDLRTATSTLAADTDPLFAVTAEQTDAVARIVHLRWATQGFPVASTNTHPFYADEMSFAHNGSIAPTTMLDDLLTPGSVASLRGDTDSERYFALIRQELALQPDPALAAASAARALRRHYPHASLNALLLTASELVVVHAHSSSRAPIADFSIVAGGAPLDHDTAYFLMRWLRTADGSLVFASSGMRADGWTALPEESVTAVEFGTLEMRHLLLDEDDATGRVA